MKPAFLLAAALVLPASLPAGAAAAQTPPPKVAAADPAPDPGLARLLADYAVFNARVDPITAGLDGDREALRRLPDLSPAALAADRRDLAAFRQRAAALKGARLGAAEALNRDLLARDLDESLQAFDLDLARTDPVDALNSFNSGLSGLAEMTAIRDRADAEAWIARLEAMPGMFAQETANARRGIADRFVQPRGTAEIVLAIARTQAATPAEADPLLGPFKTLPASIPAAEQATLRARALAVVRDRIKPAQRAYVVFMEREYLPHARASLAVRDLPNGEAVYAYAVRHHTTTAMTPDQVHALGESEVRRIRGQMDAVIASAGFKGSFAEWQHFLRTDKQFYVADPERLLERSAIVAKRIDDYLPKYFGTLPRLPFGIRPVPKDSEESQTTAYAQFGSPQLGVACGYYVNLSHLDQRPLYEIAVLTSHEAEPGHCLQGSLAQERTDLPSFRRNAYITAYVEGWGLYSEQLAGEFGLYRTPYEKFGQLSYEMWRACRLVADTGIHWLRWSKDQAKACFLQNTTLTEKNIDVEVDRYISWPGQALAYKIGELKLMELRERARRELGPKFDIRTFHDTVLLDGPLPLDVLETKVNAWISAQKG